jgi:hypothetical protein
MISGTFAKYTTSGSANDSARVAKWGVTITADGNLFGTNYASNAADDNKNSIVASSTNVASADGTNVVAPGTKNQTGLTYSISGTPEVATQVTVEITAQDIYLAAGNYAVIQDVTSTVTSTNFDSVKGDLYTGTDGAYTAVGSSGTYTQGTTYYKLTDKLELTTAYYPVKYSNTNSNTSVTTGKATDIAAAVAKLVKSDVTDSDNSTAGAHYTASNTVVAGNTDIGTSLKIGSDTVKWEWAFSADGADEKDTLLGNLMAGTATNVVKYTDTGANVLKVTDGLVKAGETEVGSVKTVFNISIKAEQVD